MAKNNNKYINPFLKAKVPIVLSTPSILTNIHTAIALHQQSDFAKAKIIYQNILEVDPENADAIHLLGVIAYQTMDYLKAVDLIRSAIKLNPNNQSYHSNLGLALKEIKCYEEAIFSYGKAIVIAPNYAEAYSNLGIAYQEINQLNAAIDSFDKAILLKPDYAEAYSNRGNAQRKLKEFSAAVDSYDKAIELKPDFAEAYSNRGISLHELKQFSAAVDSYDKAIELKPDFAEAYSNRGNALKELKQFSAAVASFDNAIALKPDFASAYLNRGNVFKELHVLDNAISSYDNAIALKPDYAEAYSNRGIALHELRKFNAAVDSYDKAIEKKPEYAEAYYNKGISLYELKFLKSAVVNYNKAIAINPNYAEAYSNRGNALKDLRQIEAAVASYDKAITLKSDYAEAYSNRGNALKDLKQIEAAIASYEMAIALKPDYAIAYSNRGISLQELKQLTDAVASYKKAFDLNPSVNYLLGMMVHARMYLCDWSDFEDSVFQLRLKIGKKEKASTPFAALGLPTSLAEQRLVAEIWAEDKHPFNSSLGPIPKSAQKSKIRIGYYSADFHDHAVSILTAGLFEHHDKSKFEIIAFTFGHDIQDEMHGRLRQAFDQFFDVRSKSDAEVASLSRKLEIDIAIDLGGYTLDSRNGIFSYRAAPVQLSYIGYLGTMGASYYDYLIADQTLIPQEHRPFYSEKIVYLPSYQVNDSKQEIPTTALSREVLNLPTSGFVYCCFNSNYKITPSTFDGWMRILKAVPQSVLLLYIGIQSAQENLKLEAEKRGVSAERLIFGGRLARAEYLARCRSADLFLDTLPYNAGATASDALWAGLPVLTCMGETFASRYAASLLNAIGLPELVTDTQAEYEALAIELAFNPAKLKSIKEKLENNRLTTPLFDTARFTKHIERAYSKMYERYQADLQPEHIFVDSNFDPDPKNLTIKSIKIRHDISPIEKGDMP